MNKRQKSILVSVLLLAPTLGSGQSFNLGSPPVRNFSSKEYRAATQNWGITQDENGIIYVANNGGLLEFDGFNWRVHPMPNGTIVRSVCMGEAGRIYVGGQGDFGIFEPDELGRLRYHSLLSYLPEAQKGFSDVWEIIAIEEDLFFQTDNKVFLFQKNKMAYFEFEVPLRFMGQVLGRLFVQNENGHLLFFEKNGFTPLSEKWKVNGELYSSLDFHPDTSLLVTNQSGIFHATKNGIGKWETAADPALLDGRLYCAAALPNGMVALGSTNNGLFVLNRNRLVHQHLTKKNGLQNSTVLSLFADRAGDLWLGLDNGIDLVKTSSPFTTIFPDKDLEGTGYAVEIFEDKIFFGTNTGVYFMPLKFYYSPSEKKGFQLVPGTEGQVWSLQVLEDELLIGHHNGAYSLRQGRLRKLTDFPGVWRFLSQKKGQAIAGHYEGLAFFEKQNGGWAFVKKLDGLTESARFLAPHSAEQIWVAHPYRGIYKVSMRNGEVETMLFGEKDGLPSDLGNHVFDLGGQAVFTGASGIFNFDEKTNRFRPAENFNRYFGNGKQIRTLRKDSQGHIWYIANNEVGVLLVEDNTIEKKVAHLQFPELTGRPMGGFEFIFPMNDGHVILATEMGFEHFNLSSFPEKKQPFRAILQEVVLESEGDSVIFGGFLKNGKMPKMPELGNEQNNLRFVFGATDHHGNEFVKFAHRTSKDEKWSEWSSDNRLIFNNLWHGDYVFELKAQNRFGEETEVLSFPFKIFPPWYASTWAKVIYWAILFGIFLWYIFSQRRSFEHEKAEIESSHQKIHEEQELKMRQLEREKLEAEVQFKNQELASTTMNLVQKNEFLSSIMIALKKLSENGSVNEGGKKEIRRIVRLIESDVSLQEDWEHFARHFDQVHSDFLRRLGEQHPKLSPNDFKLCAYLKMNLSSKEIATLMNISVRGVEASRYRLRKRLGISTSTNLTEFLLKM